ncbi:hypothetical protein H6781_01230 [Candidatus Nomurabacteria bacterium]|nr:hypothetical protein [Candidatus Nomurabacteria bacterium]MCB9818148.1 hypothetical protein [Candidatus Nomurabacteria bacterium]
MKRNLFRNLLILTAIFLPASLTFAGEFTVRPFLIDVTAEPRETITETVQLTNDSEYRKYVVYATVNEISVDKEGEIKEFVSPVMTDRTNTVTSWIEVKRGRIEIEPGQKAEIPVVLRVNPFAEPGEYHAFIGFVPAPNRPKAESIAMSGEADGVVIKITVEDKREDSMKISGFIINRFITDDSKREVDVVIENTGDLPSAPMGEIIFYDSTGVEIDSAPFNSDGVVIAPGETATLKGFVPVDKTLGRFKANLSLKYGENQRASLYDTTTFFLMPLNLLLLIFGGILLGAIIVALLFRKAFITPNTDADDGDAVTMYVKEGHEPNPQDHDIDLKNVNKE